MINNEPRETIIEIQTKQDFPRNEFDYEINFIGKYSIKNDYQQIVDHICNYLNIPINYQKNVGKNASNRHFYLL